MARWKRRKTARGKETQPLSVLHPEIARLRLEESALCLAKWNLFILFLTLLAVGCYTEFTRESDNQNSQFFQANARPYVSMGRKDGLVGQFIESADGASKKSGVVLYFHNSGHLPALRFNVDLSHSGGATGRFDIHHMARLRDSKTGEVRLVAGLKDIGGESDSAALFENWFDRREADSAKRGRDFVVKGIFEYCDDFGEYFCKVFFRSTSQSRLVLSI